MQSESNMLDLSNSIDDPSLYQSVIKYHKINQPSESSIKKTNFTTKMASSRLQDEIDDESDYGRNTRIGSIKANIGGDALNRKSKKTKSNTASV